MTFTVQTKADSWVDPTWKRMLDSSDVIALIQYTGKYVPYGPVKAVLPYLGRRAKENSSVKGQIGRELNLIDAELRRRRRK